MDALPRQLQSQLNISDTTEITTRIMYHGFPARTEKALTWDGVSQTLTWYDHTRRIPFWTMEYRRNGDRDIINENNEVVGETKPLVEFFKTKPSDFKDNESLFGEWRMWKVLEGYVDTFSSTTKEMWLCTGPIFVPTEITVKKTKVMRVTYDIDDDKCASPHNFFKVLLYRTKNDGKLHHQAFIGNREHKSLTEHNLRDIQMLLGYPVFPKYKPDPAEESYIGKTPKRTKKNQNPDKMRVGDDDDSHTQPPSLESVQDDTEE